MEVGVEHKIVPPAQRNAQVTQGSFDPGPLSDTATVRGEVPQLVEQRVGGRAQEHPEPFPAHSLVHQEQFYVPNMIISTDVTNWLTQRPEPLQLR